MTTYSLIAYTETDFTRDFQLQSIVTYQKNVLHLQYQLFGNLDSIQWPPKEIPHRSHELWKQTCFEFFIKPLHKNEYWEFNLAPNKNWNIYHFLNYRQNMSEWNFDQCDFDVQFENSKFTLEFKLFTPDLSIMNEFSLGVTAVIQSLKNETSYWALTHKSEKADFHNSDSFIIHIKE